MDYINIAIPKGKVMEPCLRVFKAIGFDCSEIKTSTKKLFFVDENNRIKFYLVKSVDVPKYVELGACDIGVSGLDTILEESRDVTEILDLRLGLCKMAVAGLRNRRTDEQIKKVATKYPKIASEFFQRKGMNELEIIKLNGSVELGPVCGISDVIVDIVETGSTLRENGLIVIEDILQLSSRLIKSPKISGNKEYSLSRIIRLIEKEVKNN